MGKTTIYILMMIMLLGIAAAYSVTYDYYKFADDYSYTSNWTDMGYGWISSVASNVTPINCDYFDSLCFGYDQKANAGSSFTRSLTFKYTNATEGHLIASFDYYLGACDGASGEGARLNFGSGIYNQYSYPSLDTSKPYFIVAFACPGAVTPNISVSSINIDGFEKCSFAHPGMPADLDVIIEVDLDSNTYSLYIDDDVHCQKYSLGTANFNAVVSLLSQSVTASSTMEAYIDNFRLGIGEVSETCSGHNVFCDEFDYAGGISQKGWDVLDQDNSENPYFSPTNGTLLWNNSNPKAIGYYSIDPYDVNYNYADGKNVTASIDAPAVSIEFDMILGNDTQEADLDFSTYDKDARSCTKLLWITRHENHALYFYNGSLGALEFVGNISANVEHAYKQVFYFGDQNKTYNFNSTYDQNLFVLYIDGAAYVTDYFNDDCKNIYSAFFTKTAEDPHVTLDNYYQYAGTDRFKNNMYDFMTQLYYPEGYIFESETESGDFAESVSTLWEDFGLKSVVSRVLFGLMLMFIMAVIVVFAMISMGQPVNVGAVAILEVFFMFVLTYIGLIPVWILIVLGIIGAGLGAYAFILHVRNT